jgi:DNA-damage-inducible protein D
MSNPIDRDRSYSRFEEAKRQDQDGKEFWSSRDLAKILEYVDYRHFEQVIAKARVACLQSGALEKDHFVDADEMIEIGKTAKREVSVVLLSRYACYLIIQNADPRKEVVALGQTYFAIQTRRQEISDQDRDAALRLKLREEMSFHNKNLAGAAKEAGVVDPIDYAIFQNEGYKGLYGGLTTKEIHGRKGLKKSQKILDHMGSTELAANLFRATQTEDKLRREGIKGKDAANQTHNEVGKKVRKTIQEIGGTMPEDLPAEESIKSLERKAGEAS